MASHKLRLRQNVKAVRESYTLQITQEENVSARFLRINIKYSVATKSKQTGVGSNNYKQNNNQINPVLKNKRKNKY